MEHDHKLLSALLFAIAVMAVAVAAARPTAPFAALLLIGGFVLWRLTTYRTPVAPSRIIVPYLVTIMAFLVHVYEEYEAHIEGFPDVTKGFIALTTHNLLTFAAFLSPLVWLAGAVMVLRRWSAGYFAASVFLFGMMFIEPTHYIAPFVQGGGFHYVGGMWTAFLPVGMGWYTFTRIRREMKKSAIP